MELGRMFVRTNLRNWPKNLQWRRRKLLSAVRGVTSTSISIVTLRNGGFLTFFLCLTTGRHLVLHSGRRKAARRRNCGPPISGLAIVQFRQYVKTHATTNVCLHVSTYCYETQHNQKRGIGFRFTMSEAKTRSMQCPSIMICTRIVIVEMPSVKCQRGNVVNSVPIVV